MSCRHLQYCVEPLLAEPWILDVDTTIKPLYGHQEGAVLGYNPKKPGRPSHCYHTYSMASTRLILDVDVGPGDEHASRHSAPSLWGLLDRLPRDLWPALLRGDRGFGNEEIMRGAEARALPFLLKLRLTANVKRMIEKLASSREWVDAGQGFEAKESEVRLVGWSRQRRVIVLRRRLKDAVGLQVNDDGGPPQLAFAEIGQATEVYEYSVLVTSLDEVTEAFGQLYRDRGDGENIFDEMKNQWGWGGYTTHDLARRRLAARMLALFYNWWNIFVRLADPSLHREAITSRPLFLTAIATRTRHARQTTIRVTSSHAKAEPAAGRSPPSPPSCEASQKCGMIQPEETRLSRKGKITGWIVPLFRPGTGKNKARTGGRRDQRGPTCNRSASWCGGALGAKTGASLTSDKQKQCAGFSEGHLERMIGSNLRRLGEARHDRPG